jgi:hypothetical protein
MQNRTTINGTFPDPSIQLFLFFQNQCIINPARPKHMIKSKRQLVNNKLDEREKVVAQQIRAGCGIRHDKKQQPIK